MFGRIGLCMCPCMHIYVAKKNKNRLFGVLPLEKPPVIVIYCLICGQKETYYARELVQGKALY